MKFTLSALHQVNLLFSVNRLVIGAAFCCLSTSPNAVAHLYSYDLNQGAQISDLTTLGKQASQAQLGAATLQDLPLDNTAYWNANYQNYSGVGTFTNVSYGVNSGGASVAVNDVTDWGWGDGTQSTLGDSHSVDFFNFRLQQASVVNIDWTVNSSTTFVNSGFSVYRGNGVYQGHDDVLADPLNPVQIDNSGNAVQIQNSKDTGTVYDAQGNISPYRDTVNNVDSYVGQFNALGSWSQANAAGNWSALQFVQAVDNKHSRYGTNSANYTEYLSLTLAAGDYTIAASGALVTGSATPSNASFGVSNLDGQLNFSYAPAVVPVPAAVWMFLTGFIGVLGLNRHKNKLYIS